MPKPLTFCFSEVKFFNHPTVGVAMVDLDTGILYLNQYKFNGMPPEHKAFVLCHEEGHLVLKTKDEKRVDAYASNKYLNAGYSITQSVLALTRYLNNNNNEHKERALLQLQRAIQFNNKKK